MSGGHDVADARLHRIVLALVRRGLRVEVRGLGSAADAPAGVASVRVHARGGLLRRLLDAVVLPWVARGHVLLVIAPEMVPMALVASVVRRRRLVVDVYEDYAKLAHDRPLSPVVRWCAVAWVRIAAALSARADVTSVADDHVPPLRARCRHVVRNLPDLSHLAPVSEPDATPRAVYIGDVRTTRGLRTMLDAVVSAPAWTLDIVGPVAPADQAWLDEWMATSPAAGRVRLLGRLPPAEAWLLARGAWVGLSLLDDTPAFREAMPSKMYEYAAAGLPVVATPLPRVAAMLDESKAGVIVRDAAETASLLNAWALDPAALAPYRDAALDWARVQSAAPSPYDVLAAEVAGLVEE